MGAYLSELNIPSREELLRLGDSIHGLEAKIDLYLSADSLDDAQGTDVVRPARTRRPPGEKENV